MTAGDALRRALRLARRLVWPVAIVAVVLVTLWFRRWSPVAVVVTPVERGEIVVETFGRGTVESLREAEVGFDMSGRLSAVLVDEGARVTLGQDLARLETEQAQADLRSAQTGIAAARSSLRRLAAEETRARAVLATAEREDARMAALQASGAVPARERDEAADRLQLARVDLDRVLAQRAEATRGVDVAAGGAEQRRVAMVRATLLAPFDGLVTRRLREPGDTVTVGSTVLRLVDTAQVVVAAAVDETVLSALAVDQPATIWFPGDDVPVPGRVSRIAWESDRQTHELVVEITPERLDRRIAIGQRADVRVELARRADVLRLPIAALHRDAAGAFVYVDRGGEIARARPRLGVTGADHVEVLDGLVEGDRVLSAPGAGASLPVGRRWEAR
jgi:HlyD family secretion protein